MRKEKDRDGQGTGDQKAGPRVFTNLGVWQPLWGRVLPLMQRWLWGQKLGKQQDTGLLGSSAFFPRGCTPLGSLLGWDDTHQHPLKTQSCWGASTSRFQAVLEEHTRPVFSPHLLPDQIEQI